MTRFIADQRTNYAVPHTLVCALDGVSLAWFYKWIKVPKRPGAASGLFSDTDRRRDSVDRAVRIAFKDAKGLRSTLLVRGTMTGPTPWPNDGGWRAERQPT